MREGEGTKFTIDRKIFSSDVWYASPWKFKIWFYLIGHANWKANHYAGIRIERGQLIRSLRTIAKDCGYKIGYRIKTPSIGTIRRICEELTKEGRIEQRSTQFGTLFTICNYNELQTIRKRRNEQRTDCEMNTYESVGEQDKKDKKEKKEETYSSQIERLFEIWKEVMEKPKAKLTEERKGKMRARLKEGYSFEDCEKAIRNCAKSGFHMGDNKQGKEYNDIMLIFRNGSKLEGFRDMKPMKPKRDGGVW